VSIFDFPRATSPGRLYCSWIPGTHADTRNTQKKKKTHQFSNIKKNTPLPHSNDLARIEAPAGGAGGSSNDPPASSTIPEAVLGAFSAFAGPLTAHRHTAKARTVVPAASDAAPGPTMLALPALGEITAMAVAAGDANIPAGAAGDAAFGAGGFAALAHADGSLTVVAGMGGVGAPDADKELGCATVAAHQGRANAVAVSRAGIVASGGDDATVRFHRAVAGAAAAGGRGKKKAAAAAAAPSLEPAGSVRCHTARVTGVAMHPAGTHVAAGSADGTWSLIEVAGATCVARSAPVVPGSPLGAIGFHPDGLLLAVAAQGVVSLVDLRRGTQGIMTLEGHTGAVGAIVFSENGYHAASASPGKGACLFLFFCFCFVLFFCRFCFFIPKNTLWGVTIS
jgi:hypothetical protein